MRLDCEKVLNFPAKETDTTYTERDTILYALGICFGFEPMDERQLRFIYERDLVAFPTIAMAIGHPGQWLNNAGVDPSRTVHAQKRMEVLAPMPVAGTVHSRSIVTGVDDKGPGRGALIHTQRDIWDKKTGQHLSRQVNTIMARGQGGFDGPRTPARTPHKIPDREPDLVCDLPIMPQQALIYRLSGDPHPLHVDPAFARRSGFTHTVLHGLATMAISTHAVVRSCCEYDPSGVQAVECRFTRPVFPGDLIRTEIWCDGPCISFRGRVVARDEIVVDHGLVVLSATEHFK